jgi:hypothetical protein
MKPIKCLLLLATVLSFAAMSVAVNPADDQPNEQICAQFVNPPYDRPEQHCLACCKLIAAPEFKYNWKSDPEKIKLNRCVCIPHKRNNPNYRPRDSSIKEYRDLIHGSVVDPDTNPDIDPEDAVGMESGWSGNRAHVDN